MDRVDRLRSSGPSATLVVTGVAATIGSENSYESDEWMGATMRRAHDDAETWILECSD